MFYYVGLDLGQSQDYTALAVLEQQIWTGPEVDWADFGVLFPEGVEPGGWISPSAVGPLYAERSLLSHEPFRRRVRYTRLLADKTGVGAAVIDSFYEKGVYPISVTIHGGSAVTEDVRGFRVPKRDLVASVQTLLQNGRLKIAPQMELAPILKSELLNFRVKINPATAHDSYEHWREADHDDLVLAVALACWYRELTRKQVLEEIMW